MTVYDADGLHIDKAIMRTFTGQKIDPFDMSSDDVVPADIVHSLAFSCRYNGHSHGYLSVARHSIHVMEWLEKHIDMTAEDAGEILLAGLLHDAAEAYIGDMIRPLKTRPEFQFFRKLDDDVTTHVLARFDLPFLDLPEIVHEADRCVTLAEVNYLRFQDGHDWNPWQDEAAFRAALYRFRPEDFR